MKIIWTDSAVQELQDAVDFHERSSQELASRLAASVLARVESLLTMPYRGRQRKSDFGYEAYVHPWPYVIVYDVTGEAIHIAGIVHTSQDRRS